MDLAQTLLRSVARSFYPPEQIIILDAVLLHSALRDDDLALLMGMQVKALRKTCSKLREDGLLSVHSRQETREGANRPFARDYFYVDTHRAIDVVKFRLKSMAKMVDQKYGQSVEEKKEYICPRCLAQYTQMEVLDTVGISGFECKQCGNALDAIAEDGVDGTPSAGHEVQSRLNAQTNAFEELLRRIDAAEIPENTFDTAIEKAIPVKRDENVNPAARTTVLAPGRLPPQTVRGLKTEEKVEVTLLDDGAKQEAERKEAEARAKFREQNQLPSWHTGSTVGLGPDASSGGAPELADGSPVKQEAGEPKFDKKAEDEEDQKKADDEALSQFYATMGQDEDDEEEDEEESEDEDEQGDEEQPSAKRVKIDDVAPMTNGINTNGNGKTESSAEESGDD
ncbi:MAG: hypothetical protein Q9159_007368 [Coniocarpon cinnabarinum]